MEKVKKKNNSSTSVDRESRRHTDRNHAVASGFVYNRCTLAGTHAPYFEVGVRLAPYLRDSVNDDELPPLQDIQLRLGYLWNKWMQTSK